jgi:Flp pilus assembly protein TadD
LFDAGDFAAAAAAFTEAITTWHEEALYYNNLGAALVAVNALEGAWNKFLEALHHNPRLDSAWANLQEIAPLLGRTQEAEQLLRLFGPG